METSKKIAGLIAKFITEQINEQEMNTLQQWIDSSAHNRELFTRWTDNDYLKTNLQKLRSIDTEAELKKWRRAAGIINARVIFLRRGIAAAFVVTALVATHFFSGRKNDVIKDEIIKTEPGDAVPGGNMAILTVTDGSVFVLNDYGSGVITRQWNKEIIKLPQNIVEFKPWKERAQELSPPADAYDIITTPGNGEYQVYLPDSSKVWLNSASSLRVPAGFSEKMRTVELTGEAWFEVKNLTASGSVPFIIKMARATIEVAGTQFNVKAYEDEDSIMTTVGKGSVKIITDIASKTIKKDQQGLISKDNKIVVTEADINEAAAWKNGFFHFKAKPLRQIMKQACKWYNREFEFTREIPVPYTFWIERNVMLSKFLQELEAIGPGRFQIKGRKIIVY